MATDESGVSQGFLIRLSAAKILTVPELERISEWRMRWLQRHRRPLPFIFLAYLFAKGSVRNIARGKRWISLFGVDDTAATIWS